MNFASTVSLGIKYDVLKRIVCQAFFGNETPNSSISSADRMSDRTIAESSDFLHVERELFDIKLSSDTTAYSVNCVLPDIGTLQHSK